MVRRRLNLGPVRAAVRRHDRGLILVLLERALEELSPPRVRQLLTGFVPAEALAVAAPEPSLVDEVRAFADMSLRREFYEELPDVSWKLRLKSHGTDSFIAEMDRLMRRCVAESRRLPRSSTLVAFEALLDLVRRVDEDPGSIVYFRDEGGAWQLGVDWRVCLPAYFGCLADEATPEAFALRVNRAIDDFVPSERPWFADVAVQVAKPAQRVAFRRANDATTSP